MFLFQKCFPTSFLLVLLPFVGFTSEAHSKSISHKASHQNESSSKTIDITIHGILLWASMGFLMPIGILSIRMSKNCSQTRLKALFYLHSILQTISVLLATAGAILSIKNFENSFNNSHQRVGLALYGAIWVQVFIGFRRPNRGCKGRSIWYFSHWIIGTTLSLAGIINTYTGLMAFQKRTSRSIALWIILFTSQLTLMAICYLFQDKWDYINQQGIILGHEPNTPHLQVLPQPRENNEKGEVVLTQPCRKNNALGSYFAQTNVLRKLFQLT